jgi:hypothetical protein
METGDCVSWRLETVCHGDWRLSVMETGDCVSWRLETVCHGYWRRCVMETGDCVSWGLETVCHGDWRQTCLGTTLLQESCFTPLHLVLISTPYHAFVPAMRCRGEFLVPRVYQVEGHWCTTPEDALQILCPVATRSSESRTSFSLLSRHFTYATLIKTDLTQSFQRMSKKMKAISVTGRGGK